MNNIYILWWEWFIWKNICKYLSKSNNVTSIASKKSIFWIVWNEKFISSDIYNLDFKLEKSWIIIYLLHKKKWISIEEYIKKELALKKYINTFKPKKVFIFSSSVVYTKNESDYKNEKIQLEKNWSNNANTIILRLFNCYWKYQLPFRKGSLIANIMINDINNDKTYINDITQKRNYIYAYDIWKIIEKLITDNIIDNIIDIWSDKNLTIEYIINTFNKNILLNPNNIIYLNKIEDSFDIYPKKINIIEYSSFWESIKNTYNFYLDNKDYILNK